MNFYDTKHGPTNENYLAEIEERERNRSPEEKERIAEAEAKRRLLNAGADVQVPCSREQYEKIRITIWQVPLVKYVPETNKLVWSGHEDHFVKKILDATDGDKEFQKNILSVKPQIEKHIKRNVEKMAEIRKEEVDYQTLMENEDKFFQKERVARKQEQVLERERKNTQVRHFTDEDKTKMIDVMSFSQEDLERSRSNLIQKKTDSLKKIKDTEKMGAVRLPFIQF